MFSPNVNVSLFMKTIAFIVIIKFLLIFTLFYISTYFGNTLLVNAVRPVR